MPKDGLGAATNYKLWNVSSHYLHTLCYALFSSSRLGVHMANFLFLPRLKRAYC